MNEINARIALIIDTECAGNKSAFARRLNITPAYAAQLYLSQRAPSDRTISDICREFGVNELWLRYGDEGGEMYQPRTREEEMAELFKSLMRDKPEAFRSRLITALLRFDPDGAEWALLERIYESVAAEVKKESES